MTGMIFYSGTQAILQAAVLASAYTNAATMPVGISAPPSITGDLIINTLQSNIKDYKASNSITMDVGFSSDNGSNITLEILTALTVLTTNENIGVNDNLVLTAYNFIPLTITYYDNYSFNTTAAKNYVAPASPLTAGVALYPVTTPTAAQQALVQTKGMVTGTSVRTLPDPSNLAAGTWLSSVVYYDDRGRVLQTYTDNIKGGIDKATNLYNFTGKILCSRLETQ